MKLIAGLLLLAIASFFCTSFTASAQASGWYLEVRNVTLTAVDPVDVAIDPGDGSGFRFSTIPDDDGDGVIQLPLVPNGGGVALGVVYMGCDIWIFTDTSMSGGTGAQVHHPLLITAEDVEGQAFGMDFRSSPFPFPQPPTRMLVPGERLTATDGGLADWPDLRLATGPEPADLADFLRSVDTWPHFSGEVIVTSLLLTGTFIPEPASWLLLLGGAMAIAGCHRTSRRA